MTAVVKLDVGSNQQRMIPHSFIILVSRTANQTSNSTNGFWLFHCIKYEAIFKLLDAYDIMSDIVRLSSSSHHGGLGKREEVELGDQVWAVSLVVRRYCEKGRMAIDSQRGLCSIQAITSPATYIVFYCFLKRF